MNKLEKLISEIMAEAETEGEPITKEEAEEMAKMELSAKSERRYEQGEEKKNRKPKEKKVDEIKKEILNNIRIVIGGMQLNNDEKENITIKNETELSFNYKNGDYTIKLIKHRPKK